jgi:hypothetical protein
MFELAGLSTFLDILQKGFALIETRKGTTKKSRTKPALLASNVLKCQPISSRSLVEDQLKIGQ